MKSIWFSNFLIIIKILGRIIRVDHTGFYFYVFSAHSFRLIINEFNFAFKANYKPPKDHEDADDMTKFLREEGCSIQTLAEKKEKIQSIVEERNRKDQEKSNERKEIFIKSEQTRKHRSEFDHDQSRESSSYKHSKEKRHRRSRSRTKSRTRSRTRSPVRDKHREKRYDNHKQRHGHHRN